MRSKFERFSLHLAVLAPLAALTVACSTGTASGTANAGTAQPAPRTGPADTLARIETLAGKAACTDDNQCRTLALGATPCGGPERYLAWSAAHTPPAEIEALGKIYAEERRRANTASGRMGACRFTPDPGAVCRAGTCVLGAAGPAVQ